MQRSYSDYDRKKAVQVRERNRIERATAIPEPDRRKIRVPRSKAQWRIQISDLKRNETLTFRLHCLPWRGRFVDGEGVQRNTAQICQTIRLLLNQ